MSLEADDPNGMPQKLADARNMRGKTRAWKVTMWVNCFLRGGIFVAVEFRKLYTKRVQVVVSQLLLDASRRLSQHDSVDRLRGTVHSELPHVNRRSRVP